MFLTFSNQSSIWESAIVRLTCHLCFECLELSSAAALTGPCSPSCPSDSSSRPAGCRWGLSAQTWQCISFIECQWNWKCWRYFCNLTLYSHSKVIWLTAHNEYCTATLHSDAAGSENIEHTENWTLKRNISRNYSLQPPVVSQCNI